MVITNVGNVVIRAFAERSRSIPPLNWGSYHHKSKTHYETSNSRRKKLP